VYGRTPDDLLAFMDFWYDQYFHNPLIEFKLTDNMGIGVFAKQCGTLSFLCDGLIGLLEYITEEHYNQLLYVDHHWILYKFNISWDTIAYTLETSKDTPPGWGKQVKAPPRGGGNKSRHPPGWGTQVKAPPRGGGHKSRHPPRGGG
jgi:hypothetical protein